MYLHSLRLRGVYAGNVTFTLERYSVEIDTHPVLLVYTESIPCRLPCFVNALKTTD